MKKKHWHLASLLFPLFLLSVPASALTVPPGGQIDVEGGLLSLPCCDLIIEGTVTVTTGEIIARNIIIRSTGSLLLGNGTLTVGGEIQNDGVLDDANGVVRFVDFDAEAIPALSSLTLWMLVSLLAFIGLTYRRRNRWFVDNARLVEARA